MNENKKSILFLINGLGVASKDSFDIKFNDMMPNLSMLMRNYTFAKLENKNYNYKNGFRNFSLGNNLLPTYRILENDTNFQNNPTIINIANDAISNHTKVQLFCFLDNEQVINQVVKIVNVLRPRGDFYIYIHIVIRQKDIIDYDNIIKMIKQLEDKITLFKNVQIGTVVGERKINLDNFYNLLVKEMGEKWPDYNRKLNYEHTTNTIPRDLNPFYMNTGFKLEANDISLFLNYEDVDCNEFINKITNVKLYTLFPMRAYSYAVNIYKEIPPDEYFARTLEENNLKCLILTTNDRIPSITYNLCGLKDDKSKNIDYLDINNKDLNITDIINKDYQYIIFDYDIGTFNEISKIKDFLMILDEKIDEIYKSCDQYGYSLYISSLYGLYKEYIVGVDKKVKLDYSKEVPVVIINNDYPASKYTLKYGDTHDLSNTIFNSITKDQSIKTLFRKRGIISFFKD